MGTEKRARQKAGRAARLQSEAQAQQKSQRNRAIIGLVVAVVAVLAIALAINFNSHKSKSKVATGSTTTVAATATTVAKASLYGTAACPATDGSSKRTLTFSSRPKNCTDAGKTYTATVKTNVGTVVFDMDFGKAPAAANAFVFLSRFHYYDATKIFRVNTGIDIIQGGGPHTQTNADPGPGFTLIDEPTFTQDASTGGLKGPYTYTAGDLALANTGQADSAGAQFFFITGPNGANLNSSGTYMVIGHVTSGLPILQKIVSTSKATSAGNGEALPNPAVTISSVTITEK